MKKTWSLIVTLLFLADISLVFGVVEAKAEKETVTGGVLVCANCRNASPALHTTQCTLMDSCVKSGYGIIVPQADKTYKFYRLDEAGNQLANKTLIDLKEAGVNSYLTVSIKGILDESAGSYTYEYEKNHEVYTDEVGYDGTISEVSQITYDETHADFEKNAVSINSKSINVSDIPVQKYTKEAVAPDIVITDGDYTLQFRKDYLLEYSDNINAGTANIKITGIGAYYKDSRVVSFEIKDERTEKFKNTKPVISKVKNQKGKLIYIALKKVSDAKYYQVQISTNKKFDKNGATKKYTVKGTNTTIRKLKKGTNYYIRVRAVSANKNKTKWSKINKIKVVK